MHKKFLIISQVFPPDPAAVGQYFDEAAQALRKMEVEVTILTSRRGYDNPNQRFESFEDRNGVAVQRLPVSSFGKASMPLRIFGQLLFLLQCMLRGLRMPGLTDLLISTSPPMGGIAALLIACLRPSVKVHYWVMDLNPDQAVAQGVFSSRHVLVRAMNWLNRRILKRANTVIALDRFMAERVQEKVSSSTRQAAGAQEARSVLILPPWPMQTYWGPPGRDENPFRVAHGLEGKFVVMYSGNHSIVHPLATVLDAADQLREDARFAFVFIGGGTGKREVEARAIQNPIIQFLPYQPLEQIQESLSAADLHVVTLGDAMNGIVHPCKIYGAMQVERPILYLGPTPSYVTDMMATQEIGWRVAHGDVAGTVKILKQAVEMHDHECMAMGLRAKDLVETQFNREALLRQFVSSIGSV